MARTLVRGVLNGTFVVALAVAGLALALDQPRSGAPSPAATGSPAAARDILAGFAPPAGAVALSADPTQPARLGQPSDAMPVAGGSDLHRFFFVAGDPQNLIDSISYGQALPAWLGGDGSATANEIFDLDAPGGLARRLEIQAVRLPGGRSALRVDAQAWRPLPRRALPDAS